ncbi:MAG: aminotransferase class V-fold PLP-dependent enzyme [Acidobacteria bacterium]|nr:aminotransferase class V-fold PLP-dependent enzyme [Acidobacteriota bacterium]MCA1636974.1 aminotransferase class V-fold PLP-dependent enzyme [Acidobacteriota bacterium]
MNEKIRSLFPAAEKYAYLNSAAVAPIPATAVKAVASQLKDVCENGSANFLEWVNTKNRAREITAQMLKVKAEQIAFMRNTSDGFSTVANGLKWRKGDNIVTFEKEFPANFYAWRRIRDAFGVELRLCPERNGRIDLNEFIGLIDENTRLVSISAVQYGSGFRADLERIGEAARKVDALFAVDIIQAFGAMPFDLEAQKVDVAVSASHKWLCSPEGCGILYLSARARERIEPTLVGWISVDEPWDFENVEQAWKPNALAWETGTGGSSLFYGLEQSAKLLFETGAEKIENYLEELTDYLCELLAGKNYETISSRAKGEKSQIVCIKHCDGQMPTEIAALLENKNIIISPRGERVRVAPHFFNNWEDIERLAENLP